MRWQDALLPAAIAAIAIAELATMDIDGRVAAGVLEVLACALLASGGAGRWPSGRLPGCCARRHHGWGPRLMTWRPGS